MEMPGWYVVYSKPQKEESAEFHLRLKGLDVFFPKLHLPDSVRNRKRVVALFPNYLFVRISQPDQFAYVIWSPGVKRFVSFESGPAQVDDRTMGFLLDQASPNGTIAARSNLKRGQRVHVEGGPFDGLVGIIQDVPDGRGRVKVLMDLLCRQVKVEVPVQFVKTDWVA